MNLRRTARRIAGVIVHNWPLKLAAVVFATVLYAGLVASQDSAVFPGPVKVDPAPGTQPDGTVIVNQLRDIDEIRYLAPASVGRLRADDFVATVDLSGITPNGKPVNVPVNVSAVDPRVSILTVQPATIQVVLDELVPKSVPVTVDMSTPPDGLTVGEVTLTPADVTVTGPSSLVKQVVSARVAVTIDSSGVNIDRDVQANPIDVNGQIVSGVDTEPALVHVVIPVYENLTSRTIPVSPIVTGTPAAGFRIASIDVEPLVVTVQGDQAALQALAAADTAPVVVSGATRDITEEVGYALPTGLSPVDGATATVTVHIEPVTETRTYTAGISLDGRSPDLLYSASETQVLLTLYGSTAVLDRLESSPIVISINVASLGPGTHEVPVVPNLASSITVAAVSPDSIVVVVTPQATPSPGSAATPTPIPTP